jgi:transcriptional regulator with XRE-family HTH domain
MAGKRQTDLVRETGIDKGAISNYLKGRYEPKQDVVYKLAKALNVSEMWLWGYECKKDRMEAQIEKNPKATAELHFEILMDEDFTGMFEEFQRLDEKKRKIVIDLVHSLAESEA